MASTARQYNSRQNPKYIWTTASRQDGCLTIGSDVYLTKSTGCKKSVQNFKIISRPHHVHRRVAELFSDLPKLYFSHSAASHFLKFPLAGDYSRRDIRKNACLLLTTEHRSVHRLVLDLKLLGRLRLVHRRAGAHADAHVRYLST